MVDSLKKVLITSFAGGISGAGIYYLTGVFIHIPFVSIFFFPLLFAAIVVLTSLANKTRISVIRSIIVGMLAGVIYNLLSPIFPLLAASLTGICIGAGLSIDEIHKRFGLLIDRLTLIIKGAFVMPIAIYLGSISFSLIGLLSDSLLLKGFVAGFWIALGIGIILLPLLKSSNPGESLMLEQEIYEFKNELSYIANDLKIF